MPKVQANNRRMVEAGSFRSNTCQVSPRSVVGVAFGLVLSFVHLGAPRVYAGDQAPVQNQTEVQQTTPTATIQAAPIEINASAPKPDPDPYALPSHAPEYLVKMRSDLEKSYGEHRILANQMLDFLASTQFDIKSPSGAQGPSASVTYGGLLRKLESLNTKIQESEVEFIHEKQVFLAHGSNDSVHTAAAVGADQSQIKVVQAK